MNNLSPIGGPSSFQSTPPLIAPGVRPFQPVSFAAVPMPLAGTDSILFGASNPILGRTQAPFDINALVANAVIGDPYGDSLMASGTLFGLQTLF
jgi:hypothetical protein